MEITIQIFKTLTYNITFTTLLIFLITVIVLIIITIATLQCNFSTGISLCSLLLWEKCKKSQESL